jgi:hypothetical protein
MNADGTPNAAGCLVRYAGSDVILSGNATDNSPNTWCTAGNSEGSFRAGPISSQQLSKTPAPLANNFQQYNNLGGTGINFWAINPIRHGQSHGILEVDLSQCHYTGVSCIHLVSGDEGIGDLSAS